MTEETFDGPKKISSSNRKLFTSLWDQTCRLSFYRIGIDPVASYEAAVFIDVIDARVTDVRGHLHFKHRCRKQVVYLYNEVNE